MVKGLAHSNFHSLPSIVIYGQSPRSRAALQDLLDIIVWSLYDA